MSDPAIKTKPLAHQAEVYELARDRECFALFWEMGLGKTKVMLDVASHNFIKGKINAVVAIAPNSVYKNWISQEVPVHLAVPHIGMAFPKKDTDRDRMKRLVFLDPTFEPDKLRFMCISYDAIRTERGFNFLKQLLTIHRVMLIADESTAIKTPSAKQTRAAKSLAKLAQIRWIATGTPVAQSPFDIHSQIEFLDEDFWGAFGLKTITAFKNQFGVFQLRKIKNRRFNELVSYRQLDVLHKIVKPISSRLLKEDSTVELPPKTYSLRTFELTSEQRKVYNRLKYEFQAELDNGMYLEAPLAIVRLARLQQITSGFVTAEEHGEPITLPPIEAADDELQLALDLGFMPPEVNVVPTKKKIVDIISPKDNPRLQLLRDLIDEASHKVIVWCKFTRDVEVICHALGDLCVRYDGHVGGRDRQIALDRFRDPNDPVKVFVANVNAISQGVTLTIAKTMIYYSNSFSLEKRLQSEDRNHRIGQDSPVLIIDLAAENTVDQRVIQALRDKFEIAALVTGDRLREWIKDVSNGI